MVHSDGISIIKLNKLIDSPYKSVEEILTKVLGVKLTKNSITLQNTFAEAFPMKASRLDRDSVFKKWALEAANSFTGFATSVIACGCEAGIESVLILRRHLMEDQASHY